MASCDLGEISFMTWESPLHRLSEKISCRSVRKTQSTGVSHETVAAPALQRWACRPLWTCWSSLALSSCRRGKESTWAWTSLGWASCRLP